MSNFYINSVKRKMKFQRLDLQNLQNDEVSELNKLSPQDEIRQDESNLRDETISNLKLKLHNNFSHILGDDIKDSNDVIDKISDIPKKRVGPKISNLYFEDLTDYSILNKNEIINLSKKGERTEKGRPTKKQRREIDNFLD